jgi:hypothetical protein
MGSKYKPRKNLKLKVKGGVAKLSKPMLKAMTKVAQKVSNKK